MTIVNDPMAGMGPMSFETVTDHLRRCRWPVEGGWCGCRTEGRRPYCLEHLQRAYLPPDTEEPDDETPPAVTLVDLTRRLDAMEAA